jgi:hypothetical protein
MTVTVTVTVRDRRRATHCHWHPARTDPVTDRHRRRHAGHGDAVLLLANFNLKAAADSGPSPGLEFGPGVVGLS